MVVKRRKKHEYHGESTSNNGKPTPELIAYRDMIDRCTNKNNPKYRRYGGRTDGPNGPIRVCARWRRSYLNFLKDMKRKPHPSLSLDRLDNDKHYNKRNCHWGTAKQQARNRSNNTIIQIGKDRRCIAEWTELTGAKPGVISERWRRYGITEEKSPEEIVFGEMKVYRKRKPSKTRFGRPPSTLLHLWGKRQRI